MKILCFNLFQHDNFNQSHEPFQFYSLLDLGWMVSFDHIVQSHCRICVFCLFPTLKGLKVPNMGLKMLHKVVLSYLMLS